MMETLPSNVQLVISIEFSWNNEPDIILKKECYVGVYDEDNPEVDSFYWFEDTNLILGDCGDFTVHDFKVTDSCNNRLLKDLEEYDRYMKDFAESCGYNVPISIKEFLEYQIVPTALSELNFKRKRDLRFFCRFKELYLRHATEVLNATEISDEPVCYPMWLENKKVA